MNRMRVVGQGSNSGTEFSFLAIIIFRASIGACDTKAILHVRIQLEKSVFTGSSALRAQMSIL